MDKKQIVRFLLSHGEDQKLLFAAARQKRFEKFCLGVFIRGVVEVSNVCENNCEYCDMRRGNLEMKRYIMKPSEIMLAAKRIKKAGLNILFLQSGENPQTIPVVLKVLPKVKKLGMETVLCLGDKPKKELLKLKAAGAGAYILKHETCDYSLHNRLRHNSLAKRIKCIKILKQIGFKVGGGNIIGLPGQTVESIAADIALAKRLKVDFVSASPFIPPEYSPLKNCPKGNGDLTLNTMAVMRLVLNLPVPTVSALDLVKENGQQKGFDAGANVITVNFTPAKYRSKYALYSKKRPNKSLKEIKNIIKKLGLEIAKKSYFSV